MLRKEQRRREKQIRKYGREVVDSDSEVSSADSSDEEQLVAYRIHAAQPIDRDQLRHRFASSEFDLVSRARPHEQVYQHPDVDYHRDPLSQKPIVPLDLKAPAQ